LRAATLESRLEELGVLRSFSRPRVSNDNPYSKSLFRTVKFRPDYPSRPFASKAEACEWVAAFVDWYNHRHRHSGIKFVTPHQRHSGAAIAFCLKRAQVYEKARQAHPKRWSQSTGCWRQPVGVVDQQATRRPRIQSGDIIYSSRLKGSQGVTPFLTQGVFVSSSACHASVRRREPSGYPGPTCRQKAHGTPRLRTTRYGFFFGTSAAFSSCSNGRLPFS